jgi:hypothetical protein
VPPAIIKESTMVYRDNTESKTLTKLSSEIDFKLGFPIQAGKGPNVLPLINEK